MKKLYASVVSFFTRFLYLQLFLTLISLPVLIAWGIPISLLTFAGNLLFSPILTLFLLLSSLLFFCTLLHLPTGILAWSLDRITHLWLWIMKSMPGSWYIGFAQVPWWMFVFLVVAVLAIVHSKYLIKPVHAMSALLAVAILFYGMTCLYHTPEQRTIIPSPKGIVTMHVHNNEICIVEEGAFSSQTSLAAWLEYTLLPTVIKKTGICHVEYCIITSHTQRTLQALADSIGRLGIKHVYIPAWKGIIPPRHYYAYKTLQKSAQEHQCALHIIGERELLVGDHYRIIPTGYRKKQEYELATFTMESFASGVAFQEEQAAVPHPLQ